RNTRSRALRPSSPPGRSASDMRPSAARRLGNDRTHVNSAGANAARKLTLRAARGYDARRAAPAPSRLAAIGRRHGQGRCGEDDRHGGAGARRRGGRTARARGRGRPRAARRAARRAAARGRAAGLWPVADLLARTERLIADPRATLVCVVTPPEELAVRETVELHRELGERLGLAVAPPIVNALPPRRFTAGDVAALDHLEAASGPHAYLDAARFQLERRRQADAQLTTLRRAVGAAPVRLPFLLAAPDPPAGLAVLAAAPGRAAGVAA